jgi:uroporphyrin-III C-methyltransferase
MLVNDMVPSPAEPPSLELGPTVSAPNSLPHTASGARPANGWANLLRGLGIFGVLLALVALVAFWQLREKVSGLERELVRRQQTSTEQAAEAVILAKQAQEVVRDTAAKVALLDTRLSEVALQRGQLEDLMQSLSRSRDENVLTDVESALRVAVQQSAITGSAEPLVVAMRSADERLGRLGQPRLERVRRALAHDLEKVRVASVPDLGAMLLRLDEAVRMVDELPLLAGQRRRESPGRPAPQAASAPAVVPAGAHAWWTQLSAWADVPLYVWNEFKQLLEVRRLDHPEAVLLAPEQAFFLRENVKLRLLNARLALLSRQTETAQGDLQTAISALERYFDVGARRTQLTLELLRQTALQVRQVSVPRPDETLAAITAASGGR